MLSRYLYYVLVAAMAIQRSAELRASRRNEAALRARGAVEHAHTQALFMQLLHGCWLVSCLLEVKLARPPFHAGLAAIALFVLATGQLLRLSAMRALAGRWTIRIVTLPNEYPVTRGIYRYLRHPNYLGVALEIAALPLVHSAWRTALIFSVLNAALLYARIGAEERALQQAGGYQESFAALPRLWPRWSARGRS